MVHSITKTQTRLKQLSTQSCAKLLKKGVSTIYKRLFIPGVSGELKHCILIADHHGYISDMCLKLRRIYMQENKFSTDIIPYYCLPRYLVPPGSFRISHALLQSAPGERITYLGTQVLLDKQPIMNRGRLGLKF